jgi:hypothetical protein
VFCCILSCSVVFCSAGPCVSVCLRLFEKTELVGPFWAREFATAHKDIDDDHPHDQEVFVVSSEEVVGAEGSSETAEEAVAVDAADESSAAEVTQPAAASPSAEDTFVLLSVPGDASYSNGSSEALAPLANSSASRRCQRPVEPTCDVYSYVRYWKTSLSTTDCYVSPLSPSKGEVAPFSERKYVVFRPIHAGWNNVRMGFETVMMFAYTTGRTLVMPPLEEWTGFLIVSLCTSFPHDGV